MKVFLPLALFLLLTGCSTVGLFRIQITRNEYTNQLEFTPEIYLQYNQFCDEYEHIPFCLDPDE